MRLEEKALKHLQAHPEVYGGIYDEQGYDSRGFNLFGDHRDTGTEYDLEGYDYYCENEWGLSRQEMAEITEMILTTYGYSSMTR